VGGKSIRVVQKNQGSRGKKEKTKSKQECWGKPGKRILIFTVDPAEPKRKNLGLGRKAKKRIRTM